MMYGPIKKLSRVNASLQQAIAAAERLFELLDTPTEVREKRAAPAPARGAHPGDDRPPAHHDAAGVAQTSLQRCRPQP